MEMVLKIWVIDLDPQSHLAISIKNSKEMHIQRH